LSKITTPTTGSVKYKGRIASLLEVGTGFHGELTGRENVYLNGAILGMTKDEITSKMDAIVEFSGCEGYIDTPVKRYSSGMGVRLGFAVAAFLEPDILIVDEVLAVGDAEFQKKAIGKMKDISRGEDGRTVLFVSHNMVSIKKLCTRVLIIENGKILSVGEPKEMISKYLNVVVNEKLSNPAIRINPLDSFGPKIIECGLFDSKKYLKNSFIAGEKIIVKLKVKPDLGVSDLYDVVWFIKNYEDDIIAAGSSGKMSKVSFSSSQEEISFSIDSSGLLPKAYFFRFVLHIPGEDNFDDWEQVIFFDINMHDINNTGYNYSDNWNPQTFLNTIWHV
jgi:lipopolysaccharide transport system ATP-binding protein